MNWKNWTYCALLTIGHFVYTIVFPSIINGERFFSLSSRWIEPSYIHAFFLSRLKFGEFARRPVTTFLIQLFESLELSLESSFLIVLYSGLFLAVILLFRLSLAFTNVKGARWSVLIFLTSFWVINAFFTEIYAYDEPWQYVFLFAAFDRIRLKKWFQFSFWFLCALITRESSLLLLPGIVLFLLIEEPLFNKSNLIRLFKVLWTLPVYGFFLWFIVQGKELEEKSSSYMRDERFKHLFYSFETIDIGIVTLTSFLAAMLIPVLMIVINRKNIRGDIKPWIYAFVLNFGINTFITFFFTMGRETRIFAQPVLMISPFLGIFMLAFWKENKNSLMIASPTIKGLSIWGADLIFIACLSFAISLFSYEIYWPTETKFFNGFQHWIFLALCASAIFFYMYFKSTNKENKEPTRMQKLSSLAFILPVLFFFGNQHGYRGYNEFQPIIDQANVMVDQGEAPYLMLSSRSPNVAENYFSAQGVDALAGDFNFQLPVKQFLYRKRELQGRKILYVEHFKPANFPFRYMLSRLGKAEESAISDFLAITVDTELPVELEALAYKLDDSKFTPKTQAVVGQKWFSINGEYSPAFKMKLSDLDCRSLRSFVTKVDFACEPSAEAALVVTIDIPNQESLWFHEYLSVFWIDETNAENVAYMGRKLDEITDTNALISFYIWNPKHDSVQIRNAEIVFNSKWME